MVHVAKRHAFAELVDNNANVPVYPRRPKASIPCALHSMHPESGTLRVCSVAFSLARLAVNVLAILNCMGISQTFP